MSKSRFNFPGFVWEKNLDTKTHEVEVGTVEEGGNVFDLEMLRNKQFANLSFMLAKVSSQGKKFWDFKSEGFIGIGLLAKVGEQVVIALIGKGREGRVERVIPLAYLIPNKKADLRHQAALKVGAGVFLGRKVMFSAAEEVVRKADARRAAEEAEAKRKENEKARETARKERLAKILARKEIMGFTATGQRRHGLPIVEGEWQSLEGGTHVVLVERIDEVGKIGKLLEAFQVIKERGRNPQKGFVVPVTPLPQAASEKPTSAAAARTIVIERDGKVYEVILFSSMDDIRTARAVAGLNGGVYVAVDQKLPSGKVEVYAVHKDRIDTIGLFVPFK